MTQEILEFIERLKNDEEFQKQMEFHYHSSIIKRRECIQKWNDENRPYLRQKIKEYSLTPQGKKACKKRDKNRRENFKQACSDLTKEERKQIRNFYKNCPEGYEVDHIQPISKGGKHTLSNLQYLTPHENRVKAYKWNDWNGIKSHDKKMSLM